MMAQEKPRASAAAGRLETRTPGRARSPCPVGMTGTFFDENGNPTCKLIKSADGWVVSPVTAKTEPAPSR
ncbi:hypothetical protein D3C86_1178250 [compost metagenome]